MSNQVALKQEQQVQAVRAQDNEAGALMTIIERISTMPDLDLDRVERLFDMHQKMLDRQQEQLFNQAMALAQSEIEGVVVNKRNDHTRSKYANIEAIHAEAKPIWTKHGFSVLTRSGSSDQPGHIRLYTEVRHSGGHKVTYEDDWPLDTVGAKGNSNKTAIQGKGSTITYARRYTELMIFDIAIKDEDNDGNRRPEPLEDITDALLAIGEADSMDALQTVFTECWKRYTHKELRARLTAAKDAKKKELSNA